MKTLKEVKKHFKNAKEVRCLNDGFVYNINKETIDKIENISCCFYVSLKKNIQNLILVNFKDEFAEIISYKTESKIKKAILEDYDRLFPVKSVIDNREKEFITEAFKYLEKVIVSDQEDFSRYHECRYACKNTLEGHVVFTEYDSVFVFKYIKKIK